MNWENKLKATGFLSLKNKDGDTFSYIKLDDAFISIPRTIDPLSVDLEKAIEIIKEKELTDAPVAHFNTKPVTKGKGRFGPFIKYDGLFINVPRAYDFENLTQANINELIEKKLDKEANRYIQHWPEEKISIENARWGPIIKFGKLVLKLLRGGPGGKFTIEELSSLSLDEVKKMIDEAYQKTVKLLTENRPALDKLAETLLDKEVIFREDLENIFGKRQWDKEEETAPAAPASAEPVASTDNSTTTENNTSIS